MRRALLCLLLAAGGFQVWMAWHAPVGLYNDDALNILLARSLASGAFALPDGAPATEPLPGFALLLALPVRLVDPRWGLLRWLCLAAGWAAVWLTWRLARRVLAEEAALAAALLVALNPVFLRNAGLVRPDVAFLAASLAVLECLALGRLWPAALLAAGAALLRPHGALLAAAAGLALWRRQGWRPALGFVATALLPSCLWAARNLLVAGTVTGYASCWLWRSAPLREPAGLARHLARLTGTLFGHGLAGLRGGPGVLVPAGAAVLGLAAAGAVRLWRREAGAWAQAAAVYSAAVLALHAAWGSVDSRYLLPLLPLACLFMLSAGRAAGLVLAAGLLMLGAREDLVYARERRQQPPELWPRTMAWIRRETPPQARFQSMFSPALTLLTGRRAEPLPAAEDRDSWLADCQRRGVDYLHLDRQTGRWSALPPARLAALLRLPDWAASTPYVRRVYSDPEEGSTIWRISRGARSSGSL
ncbi:MAG: glycosyltransferase family 39 protein [Elusimicrobia bacterium]|nr:glycosyltransferase family 39 protein [Elusimicrobiota bacterium]